MSRPDLKAMQDTIDAIKNSLRSWSRQEVRGHDAIMEQFELWVRAHERLRITYLIKDEGMQ